MVRENSLDWSWTGSNDSPDKEIEIIHELAQRVLEFENMLCEVSDICGEVDWYIPPRHESGFRAGVDHGKIRAADVDL